MESAEIFVIILVTAVTSSHWLELMLTHTSTWLEFPTVMPAENAKDYVMSLVISLEVTLL